MVTGCSQLEGQSLGVLATPGFLTSSQVLSELGNLFPLLHDTVGRCMHQMRLGKVVSIETETPREPSFVSFPAGVKPVKLTVDILLLAQHPMGSSHYMAIRCHMRMAHVTGLSFFS